MVTKTPKCHFILLKKKKTPYSFSPLTDPSMRVHVCVLSPLTFPILQNSCLDKLKVWDLSLLLF